MKARELSLIVQDPYVLTPELVKPAFKGQHYLAGHCYASVEAIWHMAEDRKDWTPCRVMVGAVAHWYLGQGDEVIDPTAAQFGEGEVDYKAGKLSRFLTKMPSNRAKTIMTRLGTKLLNLGEK
jgi:hypothetical protein